MCCVKTLLCYEGEQSQVCTVSMKKYKKNKQNKNSMAVFKENQYKDFLQCISSAYQCEKFLLDCLNWKIVSLIVISSGIYNIGVIAESYLVSMCTMEKRYLARGAIGS